MNLQKKRLGICQSRGLGDIVIALPIAHHYHKEGWEIYWPISQEFIPNVEKAVPWVKWIPVITDRGPFFYDIPMKVLKNFKCDEIICLYQALTGHPEFQAELYFPLTKFDQYKYLKAGVPFIKKWSLSECITRDLVKEQQLYDKLVTNPNYAVIHLEGSDHTAKFDRSMIPEDWDTIEITATITNSVFDWLTILERAQSIVCVDSIFSNIVDQMGIGDDRYFIPRSHFGLTPVQGQHWTWLPK